MAEITSGIRRILSQPWAYDAFQSLLGADRSRRRICRDHVHLEPGDVVVDVGCGTGSIIEHLPRGIRYFGFDLSPAYVESARKAHGELGTFSCRDIRTLSTNDIPPCDVAIAIGLLHHLEDDEATGLMMLLHRLLRPGGTLVTVDPAYWVPQSKIAKSLISRDRGRNVRTGEAYRRLVPPDFREARLIRRDDLLNIPYTHAVLECSK